MFQIKLSKFNYKTIENLLLADGSYGAGKPVVLQYCDFNVANFLYENQQNADFSGLILYPDALLMNSILRLKYNYRKSLPVSTDFFYQLIKTAENQNLRLSFIGDSSETLEKINSLLTKDHPGMRIIKCIEGMENSPEEIFREIKETQGDLLFAGLGLSRQEFWLINYGGKLDYKIVIAAGGWFRYLSGEKQRAHPVLRKAGLEWLYKLIKEFRRVSARYLAGAPLFIFRVITGRIRFRIENEDFTG